jgi:hypothetical protein
VPPTHRPPGGRIALLGSPRGLTNGGERPAVRRPQRAALDIDPRLLGPVVGGVAGALALFMALGPSAQLSLSAFDRGATAAVAIAAGLAALALAWRARRR